MKRNYICFATIILTSLLVSCFHNSLITDIKYPHTRKSNGIVNDFYDNGRLATQRYYIDGQSIFIINYNKHGKIKAIRTTIYYPKSNNVTYVFGNIYKRGKLTSCWQLDMDSINRYFDIKTLNNGKIRIDSLNRINDSINHRDRFQNRDTTIIPFRIKVVVSKDTLLDGFNFYLSKDFKSFLPLKSERYNCFFFENVDSLCDFNLEIQKKKLVFRHIEAVRLMHESEWIITIDPEASDNCFDIIREYSGCFKNAFEKHPSDCKQNNFIFIRDFELPY